MLKDKFKSLKIANKLAAVFIILFLLMGIGGSVGLYNAWQIVNVTDRMYIDTLKRTNSLSSIEKELLIEKNKLLMYLITIKRNRKASLENSIEEHNVRIRELLEEYYLFKKGTEGISDIHALLERQLDEYDVKRDEIIQIAKTGNIGALLELVRGEEIEAKSTEILKTIQLLIKEERGIASVGYLKSHELGNMITLVTILAICIAFLFAFALWRILTGYIVQPVEAVEQSARRISEGHFNERVPVSSSDEIGDLAFEFNRMAENLEGYYATLEKRVEERTVALKMSNEELIRKKQEIETANEDLVKANKMKSQFLANVSHELRTPLNSIIGFSELLLDSSFGGLEDKQRQYINYIHTSGDHLLKLINNILDLSKIEAGKLDLIPEVFQITDVIGEVLDTIKPMAHKRGITIKCVSSEGSTPFIKADKGKFKQILLNLLSNAVKFNKDGGFIHVDWNIEEKSLTADTDRFLEVSVSDTGIGINKDDLSKIFKEFEQLDASITREYGGTGLGLALTKRLVELHKGSITVESKAGIGSKFIFTIPQ